MSIRVRSATISVEAEKRADDKGMEDFERQVADPQRRNKANLPEVAESQSAALGKSLLSSARRKHFSPASKLERFENTEKRLERREKHWEVRHGSEGDEDEGEKRSSSHLQRLQGKGSKVAFIRPTCPVKAAARKGQLG